MIITILLLIIIIFLTILITKFYETYTDVSQYNGVNYEPNMDDVQCGICVCPKAGGITDVGGLGGPPYSPHYDDPDGSAWKLPEVGDGSEGLNGWIMPTIYVDDGAEVTCPSGTEMVNKYFICDKWEEGPDCPDGTDEEPYTNASGEPLTNASGVSVGGTAPLGFCKDWKKKMKLSINYNSNMVPYQL